MRKRLLAIIATAAMVVTMIPAMAFADTLPAGPDMSGNVIEVNAANAQYTLDGAYGDITGKTIKFTENITDVLDLARPTKYQGSNTEYYNYHQSNAAVDATATSWSEDIGTIMNSHSVYKRTLSNVTFTAADSVTVKGFIFAAGHDYQGGYDYVRDKATGNNETYHDNGSLSGITFEGLTISGHIQFENYGEGSTVKDITIDDCTFTGTDSLDGDAAINMISDNAYYTNIKVISSSINKYFQGVHIQGVDGLEVSNNNISKTEHNAIAVQSSGTGNPTKGTVIVKENYIKDVTDRAIRVNVVEDAKIAINNNVMVDCGDDSGELFKASDMGDGAANLENNYWDGESVETAVSTNGGVTVPTSTGIIGGTFSEDVSDFLAEGYVQGEDGKVIVEGAAGTGTEGSAGEGTTSTPEKTPDTGDDSNMVLPLAVAGLALAVMAAVVATRRRTN